MARNGARPLSRPLSRLNFVQPLQFGFKLPEPEPHDSCGIGVRGGLGYDRFKSGAILV